ncbi:hypothetical protein CAEBREN_25907 [Caenorhabditis brenneri]|uniref:CX domain-containing protein n=1 Tax=Caenorhabditis brenneri TaxID=135651 RepID=G0P9P2_CAEBE|nr:hypothetical protein CAEBREN_25907 [Caenorhabditis brenneri]
MMLLLLSLGIATTYVDGQDSKCTCPESKINHINSLSFGMTLLSPSYSSRYLNVSFKNELIIKNPSQPVIFNNREYFWDEEYHQIESKYSTKCLYQIGLYNKDLRKIRYNSTHRPSNVTFGCQWFEECCDLGCCTNNVIETGIYILLYAGIGVLIISFCSQLPGEPNDQRDINRARPDLGMFNSCQHNERGDPMEEYVLSEIVNREAPPKYDELYPNGSSSTRPLGTTIEQPQYPLETIEEVETTEEMA